VTGLDVPLGRAPLPRRRTGVINRSSNTKPPITNESQRWGGYDRVFVLVAERWRIARSEARNSLRSWLPMFLACSPSWIRWRARMLKTASAQEEAFRARSSRSHFQPFFANVGGRGEICGRAFVDDFPVSHDVEPMGNPQNDCQLLLDQQDGDAAPGDLLEPSGERKQRPLADGAANGSDQSNSGRLRQSYYRDKLS
jgi:hypothetical protein